MVVYINKNTIMNAKKNENKIQVLLSDETSHKLKNLVMAASVHRHELVTVSKYVRELIESHVKEYQGEQISFVNEHVKKIFDEHFKNKKNN